jgi:hypothetical protein
LKRILVVILSVVTIGFACLTISRMMIDYNENGVYFDANSLVTYDDDAIPAYGIITIILLTVTIALILVGRKKTS